MRTQTPAGGRILAALLLAVAAVAAGLSPALAGNEPAGTTTICFVPAGRPGQETARRVPDDSVDTLISRTLSYGGPCATYGDRAEIGGGHLHTYAQLEGRTPLTMGVVFPRSTLANLPAAHSDGKHCYDVDGNGAIDPMMECMGGHGRELYLPQRFRAAVDSPFDWVLFNWNPMGHPPPMAYGVPHFDFHFYMMSLADRNKIRPGPCGLVVHCDDYATGRVPVPAKYLPDGYADAGAVEVAMGNHLIDLSAPEHNGVPFTHTFIYGAYNGDMTFYEPMITKAWFDGLANGSIANGCKALRLPQAWEIRGWYPTRYCIDYRANRQDYTVTLTGFVHRPAG